MTETSSASPSKNILLTSMRSLGVHEVALLFDGNDQRKKAFDAVIAEAKKTVATKAVRPAAPTTGLEL